MAPQGVVLAVLLLASSGLAGCLGLGGADPGDANASDTTTTEGELPAVLDPALQPLAVLTAEDRVATPTPLPLGRWYEIELRDTHEPLSWQLIVAEHTPEGVLLAPDNELAAAYEAQWEWVSIGQHDPRTLSETVGTGVFDYYTWPLYDGAAWSSTWGLGSGGVAMRHEATFVEAIETGNGAFPGYEITATLESGTTWAYDYVPAIGWMTRIGILDDDGTYRWCMCMTGWGDGYEGPYYVGRGEQVVGVNHEIELDPEDLTLEPHPQTTFDVEASASTLFVVVGAWAEAGVSHATLTDPNGDETTFQAAAAPGGAVDLWEGFVEVIGGTWELKAAGAGVDSEAWVYAWQTFLEERSR